MQLNHVPRRAACGIDASVDDEEEEDEDEDGNDDEEIDEEEDEVDDDEEEEKKRREKYERKMMMGMTRKTKRKVWEGRMKKTFSERATHVELRPMNKIFLVWTKI